MLFSDYLEYELPIVYSICDMQYLTNLIYLLASMLLYGKVLQPHT